MVTAETAEKEYGFYATHGDAYQQFSQAQILIMWNILFKDGVTKQVH